MLARDRYLGAQLARAFVTGVQGQGVMAVIKHWAFNEQETHRTTKPQNQRHLDMIGGGGNNALGRRTTSNTPKQTKRTIEY